MLHILAKGPSNKNLPYNIGYFLVIDLTLSIDYIKHVFACIRIVEKESKDLASIFPFCNIWLSYHRYMMNANFWLWSFSLT